MIRSSESAMLACALWLAQPENARDRRVASAREAAAALGLRACELAPGDAPP